MSAEGSRNTAILRWTTESETSNAGFDIERKIKLLLATDGQKGSAEGEWERIAFVDGAGTTDKKQEYRYVDRTVQPGTYLYRLKQIDTDGRSKYLPVIEVTVGGVQEEFMLYQNFPNPFNPSTQIVYSVPTAAAVRLSVFDLLGQELEVLVNETKEVGNHSTQFNASRYSSGIYFYTLRTQKYSSVKRMIFTK